MSIVKIGSGKTTRTPQWASCFRQRLEFDRWNMVKLSVYRGSMFFLISSSTMSLVGGLEHLDYFSHHIGVMSSSQLTFTPWFFIGVGQPPTRWRSPAVAWGNPLTIPICSIYGIFTYKTGWFLWYIYHYLPTWSIWDRVAVVLSPPNQPQFIHDFHRPVGSSMASMTWSPGFQV